MIYIFRKEIKKWNKLWWLVIASLVFGSASFFFMRQPDKNNIKVAQVNGSYVSLKDFQHVYAELKSSLDDLAYYWGMPIEKLAQVMGIKDITSASMDKCVQNVLLDYISDDFDIYMDNKSFQDSLAASVSKAFIDKTGKLNMQAYQNYLSRLHMTIADYEESKEKDFKRNTILKAVEQSYYVPAYKDVQKTERKTFAILPVSLDHFSAIAKKEAADDKKLKAFFKKKRDSYKVPEKKMANYWVLTPQEYEAKISIDDELIDYFYEKHKSSLYRIPPKVKVSVIVLELAEGAEPNEIDKVRMQAGEIYKTVTADPGKFSELAKLHSKSIKEAKDGVIDFFQRGTYDPEFEKIAFLELKKAGDISKVLQTKRGFEILKLEDRIASSYKPLSEVKDDVIQALVKRKSLITLKGDLEAVVRASKKDPNIFEKFSQKHKLTATKTDWVSKGAERGFEVKDVVAQKMFADSRTKRGGYFVHQGKHVLFEVTGTQEGYVPTFEKIKEDITKDWYQDKAETLQKKALTDIKRGLFSKKMTLDDAAATYGVTIITTKALGIDDKVDGIKDDELVREAFALHDSYPVYEHRVDTTSYLVRLVSKEVVKEEKKTEEEEFAVKMEENQRKRRNSEAFLEALKRNATIDVKSEFLKFKKSY